MYCTLQEAYNIPSFVQRKKKNSLSPISQQSSPIGKISADPYDTYSPEKGHEFALSMNSGNNNDDGNQNKQNNTQRNQNTSTGIPGKDSPIWPASLGMVYNRTSENFEGATRGSTAGSNDIPYNAQANDYKFYCNNYGICTKPAIEGFENAPLSQQQRPNPNGPPTSGPENALNLPYYGSSQFGKCSPLQAPPYNIPISDATKEQYAQAMEVALNQPQGATAAEVYPRRFANMNTVGGYYDEELENYLSIKEHSSMPVHQRTPSVSQNTPQLVSNTPPTIQNTPTTIQNTPTSSHIIKQNGMIESTDYLQSPQYIMDILLFVGVGILIILLCDQIFKLGMSFGMRDTVKVLMPYLEELKKVGE
jgi:hypothetical protein